MPQPQNRFGGIPVEEEAPAATSGRFGGIPVEDGDFFSATDPGAADRKKDERVGGQKVLDYATETLSNVPGSAANLAKGVYQSVRHPYETAATLGKVGVGTLQKMTPGYVTPERPGYSKEAEAAGGELKKRYGSIPAIAETIKTDPVGAAADASTIFGGFSGAARGTAMAAGTRLPRVAATAGKVATKTGAASDALNPVILAGRGIGKIPVPHKFTPEGMYQSALRPGLSKKNLPKIDTEVATGLREGIPVSRGGLATAEQRIEDLNQDIAGRIAKRSDELGPVISPVNVTKPVNQLRPTFENQVNPQADVGAINRSKSEFLKKHTTEAPYTKIEPSVNEPGLFVPVGKGSTKTKQPLTVAEAQAEKQGTYRQLRKKYGELGSADVETQKALARGLRSEIEKRIPEIRGLNARDAALIDLEGELSRFVGREGNKNLLGLIPAVLGAGAGAAGSIEGAGAGALATLVALAMDNPNIKSRIAIAVDRTRKLGGPATVAARGVNAAGTAGRAASGTRPPQ